MNHKVVFLLELIVQKWFTEENIDKSYNEYLKLKKERCGKFLTELILLERIERMMRPVELNDLPNYGDVMSFKTFKDNCLYGGFIDSDGCGYYVKDGKITNIEIYPSDIKNKLIRKENFDTIIWFNR